MKLLYAALATALLALCSPSQTTYAEFVAAFDSARGVNNESGMDAAVRAAPEQAVAHFSALSWDQHGGDAAAGALRDTLRASWTRTFDDATVLDQIQRLVERQTPQRAQALRGLRQNLADLRNRFETARQATNRTAYEQVRDDGLELARYFEEYGDRVFAADVWALVAEVNAAMPGKNRQDRIEIVSALRRFVELRDNWNWTQDAAYKANAALLAEQQQVLEEEQAEAERRVAAGYSADAMGIDAMVLPDVEEVVSELQFAPQRQLEPDLFVRGGDLSVMWPSVALVGENSQALSVFKKTDLFLLRPKMNEYMITTDGSFEPDPRSLTEVDAGNRPKPSQFFLDEARTEPYAMWFFVGGDRERYMMAEMNLSPNREQVEVFYRSAASWRTEINDETVTFYDDNCDGLLFSEDPFAHGTRLVGLPPVSDQGTPVPAYDSMRIGGRGPRIPYSSLVKVGDTWFNLRGVEGGKKVGVRPLNPEFFKTGEVKLVWNGRRQTTPQVLVIQGTDEISSAAFDISSGDAIEVPEGTYQIGFGRIVVGRGGRMLTASIFRGDSQPIEVDAGETVELQMGEPFHIDFVREGQGTQLQIDSTKMRVLDRAGAVYTYLHGGVLEPEVLATAREDGRGARDVGEFEAIDNPSDPMIAALPRLGREALAFPKAKGGSSGGRGGGMQRAPDGRIGNIAPGAVAGGFGRSRSSPVLTVELPEEGMWIGLRQLKHPLFGDLQPVFKK